MASLRPVAQQADTTQKLCSKTRYGSFSAIGGALALGTGAAAVWLGDKLSYAGFSVVEKVTGLLDNQYVNGTVLLGATAVLTGAGVGALIGKATAYTASLNGLKNDLELENSDLNFSQMQRIADIAVHGGVFQDRFTTIQFKSDAERIQNLNGVLTDTEFSLSFDAHKTSKARGTEDRFFDLEGSKLAQNTGSESFIQSLNDLKETIEAEVRATDKYTYQQGNSTTSISRRNYMFSGIMHFAYARGIAGQFLTAAVMEREEAAKTNPKMADANFRKTLQAGVTSKILVPQYDPKAYAGMVDAAAAASTATQGKNPDSIISSVFDHLSDAKLIDGNLRTRFIADVREKMMNPEAIIPGQIKQAPQTNGSNPIERMPGALSGSDLEAGITDEPVIESPAAIKARLAAAEHLKADGDVNEYAGSRVEFDLRQNELIGLYEKLIKLLNEKSVPLDQIEEMGKGRLRGALLLRHKEGFDLFENYEANDADIAMLREEIAVMTAEQAASRLARPKSFNLASKAQRVAAEDVEGQIRESDSKIAALKKKVAGIDSKIEGAEGTLSGYEARANKYLFPQTEKSLPEPVLPKGPSLSERMFGGSKKVETQPADLVEETMQEPGAATETLLGEPVRS